MKFLWGVSTSPYQHEGGYNGPGQPRNNWARWEESGRVEPTGRAADFWNRHEEDFALAGGMGLNAFRFGISWTRVEPAPPSGAEPVFNTAALDHYARIALSARRHGLEPLVTLSHFTHPDWLGPDPWLDPATPGRFTRYATAAIGHINRALAEARLPAVRWILTVNEPSMLAVNTYLTRSFPGGPHRGGAAVAAALQFQLLAHTRARRALHDLYTRHPAWGRPRVSLNNYSSDIYWTDKALLDLLTAPSRQIARRDLFPWLREQHGLFEASLRRATLPLPHVLPFWVGQYLKNRAHLLALGHFTENRFRLLLDDLYGDPDRAPLDYIAFDYYDPFIGNAFRLPRFSDITHHSGGLRNWLMHSVTAKCWDWPALPKGLAFFVKTFHRDHPRLPIVIAENGMARLQLHHWPHSHRRDQLRRSQFLRRHLEIIRQLVKEGLPLAGYFHWSLTDNYEWGSYAARFGLHRIDFQSPGLERQPTDSLGDNAAETYSTLVKQYRAEDEP